MIRLAGGLLLLVACDQGEKVQPAKGSAQPAPAPLPVPDPQPPPAPPIDAMPIAPPPTSGVWARACNDTGKTMDALEWHEELHATFLRKGECTYYEQVSGAYGYTYAKFNLGKDEFIIEPIDYEGETPLEPGVYSYHITIVDYGHRTADIRAKHDSNATKYQVRTCNDTSFDFAESQVFEVPFTDHGNALKAHACTPYYEAKHARMTSSASFRIGQDDNFYLQPSGVGRMLPPGKWSYHLSIADGRDHDMRMIVKQDP